MSSFAYTVVLRKEVNNLPPWIEVEVHNDTKNDHAEVVLNWYEATARMPHREWWGYWKPIIDVFYIIDTPLYVVGSNNG